MPYNYFLGTDPALDNHVVAFPVDNNISYQVSSACTTHFEYREATTAEAMGFQPSSACTIMFEYESKITEGVLLEFTDVDRYGKKHIPIEMYSPSIQVKEGKLKVKWTPQIVEDLKNFVGISDTMPDWMEEWCDAVNEKKKKKK